MIHNDSVEQPSGFTLKNLSNNIGPSEEDDFVSNESFLKMSSQHGILNESDISPSQDELEGEGEDRDSNSENRDTMMHEGQDLN